MLLGQKFPKGQNEMKHFSSSGKYHVSLQQRAVFSFDWFKESDPQNLFMFLLLPK